MKKLVSLLCALAITPILALAADKFPDISHDELKTAIAEKKVALIDVNGSTSYKAGHIPGAVNFEATSAELAKVLPADKNALVVAYCANEQCSAYQSAAKAAKALGYTNVKHYPKGIQGWKKAGETTEKGS
jgi:rhodanese-related sulfurtransferase